MDNISEWSNAFDVKVQAFLERPPFGIQNVDLAFDEYEKSVFLTEAQDDLVKALYNGTNELNETFENTEEMRRCLDKLVNTYETSEAIDPSTLIDNINLFDQKGSIYTFFSTPSDRLFIIYELVKFGTNATQCLNNRIAGVTPCKHDELFKRIDNPFRGPNRNRVLRLNVSEDIVEIISRYEITSYICRYIRKPSPIILVELPDEMSIHGKNTTSECELDDITHDAILTLAVNKAIQSRSYLANRRD